MECHRRLVAGITRYITRRTGAARGAGLPPNSRPSLESLPPELISQIAGHHFTAFVALFYTSNYFHASLQPALVSISSITVTEKEVTIPLAELVAKLTNLKHVFIKYPDEHVHIDWEPLRTPQAFLHLPALMPGLAKQEWYGLQDRHARLLGPTSI